ncbi:MAG: hypothetical protein AVDCRST_MAG71-2090, partial [uncultured Lysobacter sp.]
ARNSTGCGALRRAYVRMEQATGSRHRIGCNAEHTTGEPARHATCLGPAMALPDSIARILPCLLACWVLLSCM